jgi:crotonobetainyl-CoA:carnitine CoA-transferase CaiB-like acyl-CoA transferase
MPLRPLAGTRVLDVTTSIAGPYCTEILGALGADVVKVERPDTGDDGRAWGPPFWHGASAMFLAVNADKRSLAVSLGDPRANACWDLSSSVRHRAPIALTRKGYLTPRPQRAMSIS